MFNTKYKWLEKIHKTVSTFQYQSVESTIWVDYILSRMRFSMEYSTVSQLDPTDLLYLTQNKL